MITSRQILAFAAFGLASAAAFAQHTCPSVQFNIEHEGSGNDSRAVVVVEDAKVLSQDGSMASFGELQNYVAANTGTYILFRAKDGSLHRLNSAADVAKLKESCAPQAALHEKMTALSEKQKPLQAQMHTLSAQMKQAQSSDERAATGRQMGELGRQMGEIGRQQGEVGRQEGEFAETFYAHLKDLMDTCLHNGTCPAVSGS